MKVLLIEDNAPMQVLIRQALRSEVDRGMTLVTTGDLRGGIDVLETQQVDVILLDLHLPDSQNLDTLRSVISRYLHIPIVVLTALDDEEARRGAMAIGAQDYLRKEYTELRTLPEVIRNAVLRAALTKTIRIRAVEDEIKIDQTVSRLNDAVAKIDAVLESLKKWVWLSAKLRTAEIEKTQRASDPAKEEAP